MPTQFTASAREPVIGSGSTASPAGLDKYMDSHIDYYMSPYTSQQEDGEPMQRPRQTSIGVTPREKETLDKAKQLYEQETGERTDWGGFLGAIAALGLGALGVYALTSASRNKPTVECPSCDRKFPIAHSGDLPPVVYVDCPYCDAELVVDFT